MKCGSSQDEVQVNIPRLYLVPAQDLKIPALVFKEKLGICESWQEELCVLSVRTDTRTGPICFHYKTINQSAETNLPTITMRCITKLIFILL